MSAIVEPPVGGTDMTATNDLLEEVVLALAAIATEATQEAIQAAVATLAKDASVDQVEAALTTLNGKDFATHAAQVAENSLLQQIADNTGTEIASIDALELTADQINLNTDTLEAKLTSLLGVDYATSAKQALQQAALDAINTKLGTTLTFDTTGLATAAKQDVAHADLGSILAKLSSDPATQTTLAAINAQFTATNGSLSVNVQNASLTRLTPTAGGSLASQPLAAGAIMNNGASDYRSFRTAAVEGDSNNGGGLLAAMGYVFDGTNHFKARGDANGTTVQNRADDPTTGTITSSSSTVTATVKAGMGSVAVAFYGTHAGITFTTEVSFDGGTTYASFPMSRGDTLAYPAASNGIGTNVSGFLEGAMPAGATHFRVRATAYTSGTMNIRIGQQAEGNEAIVAVGAMPAVNLGVVTPPGDGTTTVQEGQYGFNSASWDRFRNNQAIGVLGSSVRTATNNSADQTNYNGKALQLTIVVTAASGTGGVTPTVQGRDTNANYYPLAVGPAITTTGTFVIDVGVGLPNAAAYPVTANRVAPRLWRVNLAHGDASNYTYSVAVSYT